MTIALVLLRGSESGLMSDSGQDYYARISTCNMLNVASSRAERTTGVKCESGRKHTSTLEMVSGDGDGMTPC